MDSRKCGTITKCKGIDRFLKLNYMVQFIKNKESGEEYMQLFSIARTPEEAFHVWKRAKELNVDVCIDNKMLGNDWEARYAIEQHFGVSYTL